MSISRSLVPQARLEYGAQGQQQAEDDSEHNEEDTYAGVLAVAVRGPRVGEKGGAAGGEEGHGHAMRRCVAGATVAAHVHIVVHVHVVVAAAAVAAMAVAVMAHVCGGLGFFNRSRWSALYSRGGKGRGIGEILGVSTPPKDQIGWKGRFVPLEGGMDNYSISTTIRNSSLTCRKPITNA